MTLEEVKQQRANTKKSLSRIKNQVESNGRGEGRTLSSAELKCRLGILESYFKQILTYQTQIEKYDPDDNGRPEIEDLYIAAKMNIQSQLGEDVHNTTMSESTICFPAAHHKLPQLKLPTFNGKYSDYKNFISSFNQVIDREFGLTNIEKFNHLLNCLTGQALETVKAFHITNDNYPKALERLKTRYDNNSLIFMENITTLFELPTMSKYNCAQLRSLVDNVSALYSSLLSLGSPSDIVNSMLIYIVMEKVDDGTKKKWKDSLDFIKLPTWDDCSKVLERRCQFLESIDTSHNHAASRKPDQNPSKSKLKSSKPGYTFSVSKSICAICSSVDHSISRCPRFKDMDVAQRFENVKRQGLCINCLSKGHQVNNCSSTFKCKSCSRSHHSMLHRSQPAYRPSSPTSDSHPSTSRAALNDLSASVHTHIKKSSNEQVLLATAIVLVRDANGHYQLGRALLDSCSQLNFITNEFAQKLHLPRRKQTTEVASIGNSHSKTTHKSSTIVKSRLTDFEVPLSFCITPHIAYQPDAELDISSWNLPANTQLADENFFKSKRIDLLIGTETFFDILSVGQIKLGPNLPKLHKTLFGWIIAGRYTSNKYKFTDSCMLSIEEDIDFNLQRLWDIEEVESSSNGLTLEQSECESFFNDTVHRESSGRIVVKLPFKEAANTLGISRDIALKRFSSQERRFARDSNLKSHYVAFMKEYEDCGHMSLVRKPRLDEPHYFIPHHCVFKLNSTSTKLRVVFDASCPTSSQKSLNDILMVGPTIQDELYNILLRFRLHRFAITADIVKMYRQVLIDSKDRKYQYILWRNSDEEEIRTYQLNTVTYGMSAAPYLAIKSLHYLADQYIDQFEIGANTIKSSFYVDDFLGGADTIEELAQMKKEVNEILVRGGFVLDKWHSNHKDFQNDKTVKDLNIDESAVTNALGISWDQQKDTFRFSFSPKNQMDNKTSKRTILSLSSSLFDPLGLVSPLIIKAKIIMQELWILKIGWDESVPQEIQTAWEYFVSDIKTLSMLKIPRFCLAAGALSVQLHGFCDSSIRAYGCCFYFRVQSTSGKISVHVFTAKSRVAPTKRKSLPKLELCGAQLLAKLYSKIKPLVAIPNFEVILWTDSQIVLHWLKQHSSTLSVFVGNRVSEIQDLSNGCSWRHVPTQFNPADIVSRGSTVQELASSIWFNGPAFLASDSSKWPPNKTDNITNEVQEEIDKEKRKTVLCIKTKSNYILHSIEKFSSYLKIIRVIAWMLRFSQKSKPNTFYSDSLQPQELENALLRIVFNIQKEHYRDDLNRAIKKKDPQGAPKCLNPFVDSSNGFNVLKVGGRLEFAAISEGQKYPIILPRKSHFVDCYVRHLHTSNYHAGPKAQMSLIRQKFWMNFGEDVHNTTMSESTICFPAAHHKLPQLKLPTFNGKYSDYKNFISSFNQVIDREFGLTNIEKFNHLLNCLTGQALETVKAFHITNDNYPKALERLKTRYDNNSLIFMENITTLFELPTMSKYNCAQLRSLVDNVSALYSSLLSLGSPSDIVNSMLIYIVMEKVDDGTKKKWKDSLDFIKLPTWDDCSKVLERRCQFLKSIDTSHNHAASRKPDQNPSKSKLKSSKHGYTFSVSKSICAICSSVDHSISRCPRFKDMDVAQRFENVKRQGLCINCLSKGHQVNNCSSTFKCKSCSRSHHSMLHRSQPAYRPSSPTSDSHPSTSRAALNDLSASVHTHMKKSSNEQVLLATAIVLVRDANGHYQLGRALLDSCSQLNFITNEFAQKLHLPRRKQTTEVASIGNSHSKTTHKSSTIVKSRLTDFEVPLSFCITPHIAYQPDAELDISSWNLPANTQLADENFFKSKRIDLLIGTETFFDILSVGQIKLGPNLPKLHKTLFGWIIAGRYTSNKYKFTDSCMLSIEEDIDFNLQRLWDIEEVESSSNGLTLEQSECESFFNDTVHWESSGRIVVKLPFKEAANTLGISRDIALKRFSSQERRFARDSNLKSHYVAFMKEYEDCGHMSLVRKPRLDEPHYFIPHHCVFKLKRTSTKLRVVFDASCPTSSQKSLNDILMVGPTIQDELYNILLRFRLHRFAITADIVKMYRQVLIDSKDRKYQYILWRNSDEEEIRTYQLNTVTYGMSAAPYLAIKSLHYLADQYIDQFEIGANTIKSSFYVDDFLGGADTIEELAQMKKEVNEILVRGGFVLDKWHSNHKDFQNDKTVKDLNIDESAVTNALGISWDQQKDTFRFSFSPKNQMDNKTSKRTILSLSSSLFDPLGLVSPLIIKAKIIMQELWILKIGWDESVPQEIQTAWEYFVSDIKTLSMLKIPRFCLAAGALSVQLHGFCDSSIRAYGCCFYFRVQSTSGKVSVHAFTAKSRVAPTKRKALPKLELCGAQLLAKLYSKIKPLVAIPNFEVILWTDSQIVLHWLKQHSSTLSVFVGNRVSEIQDLSNGCSWRHVPTQFNPADIVSRGSTVQELASSIWFNGPAFLASDSSKWPPNKTDNITNEVQEEIDKEKRKTVLCIKTKSNYILHSIEKFSSYLKIIRVIAWMLRFSQKSKPNTFYSDSLQPQELENALLRIVFNIQKEHYRDDLNRAIKKKDPQGAPKCLNPFVDSSNGFNLLKVGGRLEFAAISEGQKYPIILPSKSHFVDCYVRHLHTSNYHAGPKAQMSLIRQKFWIINSRKLCRHIVNSCPQCIRYRPKLLQQMMGNLPVERLNPSRPFARCAVDFCGPVNTYLRVRGKVPYKTYIAVFVCLATKAVHIKVVSDLSTDAFIAALKRMIGRRGLPTDIFCDNATNFVGANSKAPHFGGLWEAAVKSAKGHLSRTLANTKLTYEELTTAMIEIEAILNSRPISPLSADPSDFEALTPGHLLIGSPLRALPEWDASSTNLDNLQYWARISAIKQQFWKKWSRDYINELQTRNKWTSSNSNVTNGSLVIIHEDSVPPQRWLMGKIIKIIRGRDDRVRVVDIKTAKGVIRRPIHKLALLCSS